MTACVICDQGPAQGVALFRVNATGRPGVFACADHLAQTDAALKPELRALVEELSRKDPQ